MCDAGSIDAGRLDLRPAPGRPDPANLRPARPRPAPASGHTRFCRKRALVRAPGLRVRDGRVYRRPAPPTARHLPAWHAAVSATAEWAVRLHPAERHLVLLPS